MPPKPRAILAALLACSTLSILSSCGNNPDAAPPIAVRQVLGEVGISPGQFAFPRCLDSDSRSLWVIDKAARVQRLDPRTGRCLSAWRMPEFASGKPTGLCVFSPSGRDEDELLFIPDTHYHRILLYRPAPDGAVTNEPLASIGSYGSGPGQFIYLTDVAVLPTADGRHPARLYVSEYGGNDRISILEPDPSAPNSFRFLRSFGRYGSSDSPDTIEFSRPQSLDVDPARRRLVVTDACNHRVGVFDLEGNLIRWIPANASARTRAADPAPEGSSLFRYPYGLVLLQDGTALISEQGAAHITRVDLDNGAVLSRCGRPGRLDGELVSPWGVTVLGDTAFVLDSGNNRILSFAAPSPRLSSRSTISLAHDRGSSVGVSRPGQVPPP